MKIYLMALAFFAHSAMCMGEASDVATANQIKVEVIAYCLMELSPRMKESEKFVVFTREGADVENELLRRFHDAKWVHRSSDIVERDKGGFALRSDDSVAATMISVVRITAEGPNVYSCRLIQYSSPLADETYRVRVVLVDGVWRVTEYEYDDSIVS